jgi:hypothetical protein
MTLMDAIQQELETFLSDPVVGTSIDEAVAKTKAELRQKESVSLPITLEDPRPPHAQLIRTWGAKRGFRGRVERHPNSFQTLLTVQGSGVVRLIESGEDLRGRWTFVPENVWHQPISGAEDWVAITFHSAPAEAIIDEYRDQ